MDVYVLVETTGRICADVGVFGRNFHFSLMKLEENAFYCNDHREDGLRKEGFKISIYASSIRLKISVVPLIPKSPKLSIQAQHSK